MNKRTIRRTIGTVVAMLATGGVSSAWAGTECRDLALLQLPGTLITVAEERSGPLSMGPGAPVNLPAHCRVAGTIHPDIRFEVWLPANYNGRFQAVGGGGLAGVISESAMVTAIRDGYASASTDTGHRSSDTTVWVKDRQRREDYGYRAIHEMTVAAKAIIGAHYGMDPAYSYFNGCSTGGRQGLMEAQRFPNDYDGILSGAPVNTFTRLHIGQLWTAHATLKEPGAVLTGDDFTLVNNAVMAQCDANDGVEDGILTDPSACDFNPRDLVCRGRSNDSCLAEPKVRALEMIYGGAVNPRTGEQIYPGLEPGGEHAQPGNPGWAMIMNGRTPFFIDTPVLGGMGFENDDWDWQSFDFDQDVTLIEGKLANVLDAVSPDLHDFEAQGGKLIVYHGWNDPRVMPQRTTDYYNEVVAFSDRATSGNGQSFVDDFARLYMMPGMGHCRGGVGPDQANFIDALVDWVEKDQAPERIIASNSDGSMSRPLCPHPQVAVYRRGDANSADSFVCE